MVETMNEISVEDIKTKAGEISLQVRNSLKSRRHLAALIGLGLLTAAGIGYWLGKKRGNKKIT